MSVLIVITIYKGQILDKTHAYSYFREICLMYVLNNLHFQET